MNNTDTISAQITTNYITPMAAQLEALITHLTSQLIDESAK